MFGSLFAGRPAGAADTIPAQPQPAPQPATQAAPQAAPGAVNPGVAPQPAQAAQQPAQAQPTQPAQPGISLRDLVANPTAAQMTPEQYADNFIGALLSTPAPLEHEAAPSGINVEAMRNHYAGVDMTAGIDMDKLIQQIGQGDPNAARDAMRAAFNAQSLNTITMFAPLVNQLVARAVAEASQRAVIMSHHDVTSGALITAFADRYPYAQNPATMRLLNGFAETLVQNTPRGTPINTMVESLDRVFRGLAIGQAQDPNRPSDQFTNPNAQVNFTDVFK